MNTQDTILRAKIQNKTTELVKINMDDDGNIKFDQIKDAIVAEFSEEALNISKEQFNFMLGI